MSYFDTENLVVGDTIGVLPAHCSHSRCTYHDVSKVNKKTITLDNGKRFSRHNGHAWGAGNSWYYSRIVSVAWADDHNNRVLLDIRRDNAYIKCIEGLKNIKDSDTSIDKLEAIVMILEK